MAEINPELASLIPPLTLEEYTGLERSILEEGVREPVVTWNGWIVDGHNRHEIAEKHGLPYDTVEYSFADIGEAKLWMLRNQMGRRNLNQGQKAMLTAMRRELLESVREAARERERAGVANPLATLQEGWTNEALAKEAGVSPRTMQSALRVLDSGDDELVRAVVDGSVSVNQAEEQVKRSEKPHVAYNTGVFEWYTPPEYADAAREVMGGIDLDPASSEVANATIGASEYYTMDDDGLSLPWHGRLWLNPPYSSELIGRFTAKLVEELPNVDEAIVLVNNATETEWFHLLASEAGAVCFPRGRVRFLDPDGRPGSPLQGQAVIYFGSRPDAFCRVFGRFGWVAVPNG